MIPTAVSQVIEALGKLILGLGFAIIAINNGYSMPIVAAFAVLGLTVGTLISLLYLVLYKFLYRTKETIEIKQFVHVETNSSIIKQLLT